MVKSRHFYKMISMALANRSSEWTISEISVNPTNVVTLAVSAVRSPSAARFFFYCMFSASSFTTLYSTAGAR